MAMLLAIIKLISTRMLREELILKSNPKTRKTPKATSSGGST